MESNNKNERINEFLNSQKSFYHLELLYENRNFDLKIKETLLSYRNVFQEDYYNIFDKKILRENFIELLENYDANINIFNVILDRYLFFIKKQKDIYKLLDKHSFRGYDFKSDALKYLIELRDNREFNLLFEINFNLYESHRLNNLEEEYKHLFTKTYYDIIDELKDGNRHPMIVWGKNGKERVEYPIDRKRSSE